MEIKSHTFDDLIHKWNNLPIFLILLTGFLLRLIKVSTRGIWYDDAFSILLANRSFADIIRGTAADTMPPVYYFLLHIWGLLSQQIWFLRSLNILLSTSSIFLVYILVKKLSNPKAAIIAGFLTAISPFQIFHAQELRMYVVLQNALLIHIILFIDIFIINIKIQFPQNAYGWICVFRRNSALYPQSGNIYTGCYGCIPADKKGMEEISAVGYDAGRYGYFIHPMAGISSRANK